MLINRQQFSISIAIASLFFLAGSKVLSDYNYIMTHPDVMEQEFTWCQAEETSQTDAHCADVKRAVTDFTVMANVRRLHPQDFGDQVLLAEMEMSAAGSKLKLAREKYRASREISYVASFEPEKELQLAQDVYDKCEIKVKILLAVIAATSIE
jgi:hypothetical protein